MNSKDLAKYIDHTILAQNATQEQIQKLCDEALEYKFCSVCVNSSYVPFAHERLKDTTVKVCAVVGFPLGAMISEAKAFEASKAVESGAKEIDMVINVGLVKNKDFASVKQDIAKVQKACGSALLKVIFETCLLSKDEIKKVAEICRDLKVGFVKTSTGFSTGGATVEDVKLMKETVGDICQVKASGGVRSYETAMEMINAGATRIGTSSGIAIVSGSSNEKASY